MMKIIVLCQDNLRPGAITEWGMRMRNKDGHHTYEMKMVIGLRMIISSLILVRYSMD